MKYLAAFLVSFMLCPGFALAQGIDDKTDSLDTEEERCFFDLTVIGRQSFIENNLASNWCGSVHKLFGFDRSCFIRRHNNGSWVADFRHQRRFHGSSYDELFRGFTQWSDRHLFRGIRFDHFIRYSPTCFGRGGGGNY